MQTYDARKVFLPYCIKRLEDGRYIVLNRRDKPLGIHAADHVVYETHPTVCKMDITPEIAKQLSWEGSDKVDAIYLYRGGVDPREEEHWRAYTDRLAVLSRLAVQVA